MPESPEAVTMVKGAIHNPDDPRHFMRVVEAGRPVTASLGALELARSGRTLTVKEVAYDIYDPVLYFPREDVVMDRLRVNARTTHCPLKGDTEYFDAVTDDGVVENVAWSYVHVIPEAAVLESLIAFDTRRVHITELDAGP